MHHAAILSNARVSGGLRVYAMRRHHHRDEIRSGTGGKFMGSHATPMCVWPCLKQLGPERFNSVIEGLELGIVTHAKISNDDSKRERGNNFLYTITSYWTWPLNACTILIYTNVKFKRSRVFINNFIFKLIIIYFALIYICIFTYCVYFYIFAKCEDTYFKDLLPLIKIKYSLVALPFSEVSPSLLPPSLFFCSFLFPRSWSTRVTLTRENTVIQSQYTITRTLITRILHPNIVLCDVIIRCE